MRALVEALREENARLYGSEEAQRSIRTAVQRAFQPWSYVFELVQNALDAKARRVRIATLNGGLAFEHDGTEAFDEPAVRAVSKLGMSTKRLDAVGFMGVGFKSVFKRFRRIEIADGALRMGFDLGYDLGPKGDRHPRWVDTVLPRWSEHATAPSPTYTTRFELEDPIDGADPSSDVTHLVDPDAPHTLAILGLRGLREIAIDGTRWEISHLEERSEIVASAGAREFRWLYSECRFSPSNEALVELLEFRDVLLEEHEAERQLSHQRAVIGFVPLGSDCRPELPPKGLVYSTLPTEERIPLRLFLQADWFLNITRERMLNLERSPWHREILAQVPAVVAKLIAIFAERGASQPSVLASGLALLELADADGSRESLGSMLTRDALRENLARALRPLAFVPVHVAGRLAIKHPGDVVQPPLALTRAFAGQPELRADLLFGGPVIDASLVSKEVSAALIELRLTQRLEPSDVAARWPAGLDAWWRTTRPLESASDDATNPALTAFVRLAAGIRHLERLEPDAGWGALPCVPTDAGPFCRMGGLRRYAGSPPTETDPGGPTILARLGSFLIPPEERLLTSIAQALVQPKAAIHRDDPDASRAVKEWYERDAAEVSVEDTLRVATDVLVARGECTPELVVAVAAWARTYNRYGAIGHVLVTRDGREVIAPKEKAVVAEPYSETGDVRRMIFADRSPISSAYLMGDSTLARAWGEVFEQRLEIAGRVRVTEIVSSGAMDREAVARTIGAEPNKLGKPNRRGFTVVDHGFTVTLGDATAAYLARWLEAGHTELHGTGRRLARWENRGPASAMGTVRSRWVEDLARLPWVPTRSGKLARPSEVLLADEGDDGPVATLGPSLVETLTREGLAFGGDVPRADVVRRLRAIGDKAPPSTLASLLRQALEELRGGRLPLHELRAVVIALELPRRQAGARVGAHRIAKKVGQGGRSGLADWIVEESELDDEVRGTLTDLGHSVFDPPDTTTGWQALAFLVHVWKQAAAGERLSADELRRVLPSAYAYVLEDAERDPALLAAWQVARPEAFVFAKRSWLPVVGPQKIAVNDLLDPRFNPYIPPDIMLATPGHLGETREQVARAAQTLSIPLLSAELAPSWVRGHPASPPWLGALEGLCRLLSELDRRTPMSVLAFEKITLRIGAASFSVGAYEQAGTLHIAGRPTSFMTEAAEAMVAHYQLSQRGGAVPSLIGALAVLHQPSTFEQRLHRLAHQLDLDPGAGPEAKRISVRTPSVASVLPGVPEEGEGVDAAADDDTEGTGGEGWDALVARLHARVIEMKEIDPEAALDEAAHVPFDQGTSASAVVVDDEARGLDDNGPREPAPAPTRPAIDAAAIRAEDVTEGTAVATAAHERPGIGDPVTEPNAPRRGASGERPEPGPRDWAAAEAVKREAGRRGERVALESERARLRSLGIDAERVVWHSREHETAPYDLRSVDETGEPFYIEVKSTSGDDEGSDFEISAVEIAFGVAKGDRYAIYRVVNVFGSAPRVYRYRNLKRLLAGHRAHVELASAKMRLPRKS